MADNATRTVFGGPAQPVYLTNNALPATATPTGADSTMVQGTAADGAAAVGRPVQIGALDGTGNIQALRTPAVFKTTTATASGNTALWTPAAGKKFRLMGYIIQVTAFAASATPAIEITFQDGAAAIGLGSSLSVPAVGASTGGVLLNTGDVQLGNGKLSAAANNVLNINLNAALTAGLVRVTVWGTEE